MGHEKQAAPSFPVSLGHRFTLAWAQEEEMKSQILENQGQQGLRKHRAPQPRLGQVVEIVFVTHTDSCLLFFFINSLESRLIPEPKLWPDNEGKKTNHDGQCCCGKSSQLSAGFILGTVIGSYKHPFRSCPCSPLPAEPCSQLTCLPPLKKGKDRCHTNHRELWDFWCVPPPKSMCVYTWGPGQTNIQAMFLPLLGIGGYQRQTLWSWPACFSSLSHRSKITPRSEFVIPGTRFIT